MVFDVTRKIATYTIAALMTTSASRAQDAAPSSTHYYNAIRSAAKAATDKVDAEAGAKALADTKHHSDAEIADKIAEPVMESLGLLQEASGSRIDISKTVRYDSGDVLIEVKDRDENMSYPLLVIGIKPGAIEARSRKVLSDSDKARYETVHDAQGAISLATALSIENKWVTEKQIDAALVKAERGSAALQQAQAGKQSPGGPK